MERLRRGARTSANVERDEALLEYKVGGETAATSAESSPRLDAMDIDNSDARNATVQSLSAMTPTALELPEAESMNIPNIGPNVDLAEVEVDSQVFPLDWSWLLGESGYPGSQTGDPTMFWSQLQNI